MTTEHPIDRDEVMAYADGELAEARAAIVRDHLAGCDECRDFADELGSVSRALARWQVEPPPGLLRARVTVAAVEPEKTIAPLRRKSSWRWSVVALSTAAAVVLIVTLTSSPPERSQLAIHVDAPAAGPGSDLRGVSGQGRRGGVAYDSEEFSRSSVQGGQQGRERSMEGRAREESAPMMVRTATIALTTDKFDTMRDAVERVGSSHAGHIGQLDITGTAPSTRVLRATLRIPAARMDGALAALRALGRVTQESVTSEEITDRYRDLAARLANSRKEEQRLVELLAKRTGDLAEVLQVEQAIARVRGEIERMDAQQRGLKDRVDLATVRVEIVERYRAEIAIGTLPISTRFRNAIVDGGRDTAEALLAVALVATRLVPAAVVVGLVLMWPVRRVWRKRAASR